MRNYFALTAPDVGNQKIDFSPIGNALDAYQDKKYRNALMADRQEEKTYQRGRDQMQDARQAESDNLGKVKRIGEMAAAYDRLTDPAQRAAGLKRIMMQHPNAANLGPEYQNPETAFKLIAADAGQWRDPREDKLADLKIAQAQKDLAAAGTAQTRVGLQPIYGRDEQGNIVILQPSASGEMVQARPPQGVTIDPGLASGIKAQATASGKATGEAAAGLSKIEGQAQTALDTIEKLRTHDGRSEATGWGSLLPDVAFTNRAGRGFIDLYNQAQGGAFLQAFESLKGGGHITEIEGRKATEAISRINRAQRPEDFDQGLNDLKGIIERGVANARAKAQGGYSAPQAAPTAQPSIPPQAAQMLAADPSPEAIREFEEVFGAGAAQRVLNGR